MCIGEIKKIVIYFSRLLRDREKPPEFLAGSGMEILSRHGFSVRLSGVIIGKLRREKI